jgi:septin family protein
MSFSIKWSACWRRVLDLGPDQTVTGRDVLCQRYVAEMQRTQRFKQYAERMHYPHYREKFLQMAKDTNRHATRIGEKIIALGARLPDIVETRPTDENSWHSLSRALDEESRSAGRLEDQLRRIESEHPDIAELLQQIFQEQATQRREIQAMLMRSDPFAQSMA